MDSCEPSLRLISAMMNCSVMLYGGVVDCIWVRGWRLIDEVDAVERDWMDVRRLAR